MKFELEVDLDRRVSIVNRNVRIDFDKVENGYCIQMGLNDYSCNQRRSAHYVFNRVSDMKAWLENDLEAAYEQIIKEPYINYDKIRP